MNILKRFFTEIIQFPFHPLILGIYPVVTLYAWNQGETGFDAAVRLLLVCLTIAVILFALLRLALHDWFKAALLASLILVLFYSYGHVYAEIKSAELLGVIIGRHRYLAGTWLLLLAGFGWLILLVKSDLTIFTRMINLFAIVLIAIPLYQIVDYSIRAESASRAVVAPRGGVQSLQAAIDQPLPDIYLIILDKYARDDVLLEEFDYDNAPFLEELRSRGFYVAQCSQSNYSYTGVALSSELNLDYLQEMRPEYFVPANSADRTLLSQMVRHSVVRESLEQLGYTMVDISSHEPIQIKDAAVFIDPNDRLVTNASADLFINPFEAMFIRTTALAFPLDMDIARNRQVANAVNYPFLKHLRAQQYVLASADRIISARSPKFVLYHIDIPHPPFVFGPNGETYQRPEDVPGYDLPAGDTAAQEENQKKLYRDQVIFINKQIIPIIDKIISESPTRPVIILQGDHGTDGLNRMAILNSYYVPEAVQTRLFPGISPVNSFRLLFDGLFGTHYGLLPDVSYYSYATTLYDFSINLDTRQECK
ncbi:MAG: hypothetical protein WBV22_01300 [Anaerolineaceae bacterium]